MLKTNPRIDRQTLSNHPSWTFTAQSMLDDLHNLCRVVVHLHIQFSQGIGLQ